MHAIESQSICAHVYLATSIMHCNDLATKLPMFIPQKQTVLNVFAPTEDTDTGRYLRFY